MLYLSPSCGAAGVFLGGAGLGVSISSPTYRKSMSISYRTSKSKIKGHQVQLTYGANLCVAGGMSFRFLLLPLLLSTLFLHIPHRYLALLFLLFLI